MDARVCVYNIMCGCTCMCAQYNVWMHVYVCTICVDARVMRDEKRRNEASKVKQTNKHVHRYIYCVFVHLTGSGRGAVIGY